MVILGGCIINNNIHCIYEWILYIMKGKEGIFARLSKIMNISIAEGKPGP